MDPKDPRSTASQRDEGMAAARRIWAGPLTPYLLKHGLLAAVVSLVWVGVGWIAVLASFVIVLAAQLLIRAHFIRRYGRGDEGKEPK